MNRRKLHNLQYLINTIDAMGTHRAIADKIIDKQADYILCVEGNHGAFEEQVHTLCKRPAVCDKDHFEAGVGE